MALTSAFFFFVFAPFDVLDPGLQGRRGTRREVLEGAMQYNAV
jgi:hypothetical protein